MSYNVHSSAFVACIHKAIMQVWFVFDVVY